ncbi:MAG: CaiB/BaiF CoA-transferase family protein [Acidobacteriota bacterium]
MGPLTGFRILEIAGLGPAPFCAMLLSDLGAEVVRIDRLEPPGRGVLGALDEDPRLDLLQRGRRSLAVDLKHPRGAGTVLRLVERADALIEGFRPGVAERLGIGPEACLARNPRLVYGRMTGWGQEGPLAAAVGHDIDYIALSGALHAIGRAGEKPALPLNLVGDFGGGALYLAVGVLAGLLEASRSGKGQVVDAAMVDGAASLLTMFHGMLASGTWRDERGVNLLDGGAPFYDVYETADGKHLAVGALEPRFYAELLRLTGLKGEDLPAQADISRWPELRRRFAEVFRQRTRDEWCAILEGTEACVAPVLSLAEAPEHPHMAARGTFAEVDGVIQPAPAPRFSRTPGAIQGPPEPPGASTDEVLADWDFAAEEIGELRADGVVGGRRVL